MREGVTAEQAQTNLERKRKEYRADNPPILSMSTKMALDEVLSRVLRPEKCFKHKDQDMPCELCRQEREKEERRMAEQEKALREAAIKERMNHPEKILSCMGIDRRHLSCSLDNYDSGDKVKAICKQFLADPFDLVLTGSSGTGKTHIAVAVLRELVRSGKANPETARFIPVPELLREIRASYNTSGEDNAEETIVSKYADIDFLALDDLGAEKSTEWSIAILYLVIDRRHRELRPTITTTNMSLDEISVKLSPRIASRLASGRVVVMSGVDHRTRRGE